MKLIYHKEQSQLIELFIVTQYIDGFDTQLDAEQKELLKDLDDDIVAITTYLKEQESRIQHIMLQTTVSLGLVAFQYLIFKGYNPCTLNEYAQMIQQLTDDDYLQIILKALDEDATYRDQEQLYQLLEASDAVEEARKWLWFKAIRNPRQHFIDMIDLLQTVAQFYAPFYQKHAEERDMFAESFSLEALMQRLPFLDANILTELSQRDTLFVPLSPWLITFILLVNSKHTTLPAILCIGSRIEQATEQKQLSTATLIDLLKTLSDLSRYAVLKELTLPNIKAKDVAEKLDITNAAVSYHTQKLLSTGFLVADIDAQSSKAKYSVNKPLLKEIIAKLESDFQLNED